MLCGDCGKELSLIQITITKAVFVCTHDCSYNKRNVFMAINRHYSNIRKPKEKLTQSDQLTDDLNRVFNSLESKIGEESPMNVNDDDAWISSLLNDEKICDDVENDFDIEKFLAEVSDHFSDKNTPGKESLDVNKKNSSKWDKFKFTSVTVPLQAESSDT